MADKLSKKELRAPDAFQRAGAEAQQLVQPHQKMITVGVLAALAIGGGVALVSYFNNRNEEKAEQALAVALKVVDRRVGNEPTEPAAPDSTDAPFKTQAEKDAAVVKSLNDFRAEHGKSRAASTAELPLAQALLRTGQYDDALAKLDDYLKQPSLMPSMKVLALEGRGYAYEGKGQLDQALAAFDQLNSQGAGDFMNGMGSYHHARVLAEQNKKAEAAQAFQDVETKFPATAAARLATERLTLLAAEGFKPPAPAPATLSLGKDGGAT